jgi:hypothetical protein
MAQAPVSSDYSRSKNRRVGTTRTSALGRKQPLARIGYIRVLGSALGRKGAIRQNPKFAGFNPIPPGLGNQSFPQKHSFHGIISLFPVPTDGTSPIHQAAVGRCSQRDCHPHECNHPPAVPMKAHQGDTFHPSYSPGSAAGVDLVALPKGSAV